MKYNILPQLTQDEECEELQRLVRKYPMEAVKAVRHLEVAPEPKCPADICTHYISDNNEHLIF